VKAVPQLELEPLKKMMSSNKKFEWIGRRITAQWPMLTAAFQKMMETRPYNSTRRQVKGILVLILGKGFSLGRICFNKQLLFQTHWFDFTSFDFGLT